MSIREDYFGTYQSVFLNRIEGHCLQEIKDSKKFLLGTKEELYQKKAKQELAENILKIIQESKNDR